MVWNARNTLTYNLSESHTIIMLLDWLSWLGWN